MEAGGRRRTGSRRGNLRISLGRRRSVVIDVRRPEIARPRRASPWYLVAGFALLIAFGTLLLMLPLSTRDGHSPTFTTALFTATTAVCVTGLGVVDTRDYWSPFGQAVVLMLIQLGGLGFMTSSTLLLFAFRRRLSMRQRMIASETLGRLGAENVRQLIVRIVRATLAIEAAGAVTLIVVFGVADGPSLDAVWRGVFTAVSAFNNAGLDVEGGFSSFIGRRDNAPLLIVTSLLVVLGGTGYAVWSDVVRRPRLRRLALDTKIVLLTSAVLWTLGALVLLAVETQRGGVLDGVAPANALLLATAESVYTRTAGFTVMDPGGLGDETLLIIVGLMFIGGASASTAGGIKVTTFSTLLFAIIASLRGAEHVTAFEREIPWPLINRALSVALLSVAIVFTLSFMVAATSTRPFVEMLFEATSAFGTVGLSTGVTPELTEPGRLVIIAGMFIGRLGPLTLALALIGRATRTQVRYAEEEVNIG